MDKAVAGKAVQKILLENDKVRVYEVTFKPGDEGANVERPYRIVRAFKAERSSAIIRRKKAEGGMGKREK